MRPTPILNGARRFQLTTKTGPREYYKGNRASFPDGIGYRTGPNGKHVVRGTAKYRIVDEMVRIFVGPGFKQAGSPVFARDQLRPFASSRTPPNVASTLSKEACDRLNLLQETRASLGLTSRTYLTADERAAREEEATAAL